MTPVVLYPLLGAALVALGFYALAMHRHLLRKILAVNVMGSGVFLVLGGLVRRGTAVDPVPHAMVLTGIVVAVAATALALALMLRLRAETGHAALPEQD